MHSIILHNAESANNDKLSNLFLLFSDFSRSGFSHPFFGHLEALLHEEEDLFRGAFFRESPMTSTRLQRINRRSGKHFTAKQMFQ